MKERKMVMPNSVECDNLPAFIFIVVFAFVVLFVLVWMVSSG